MKSINANERSYSTSTEAISGSNSIASNSTGLRSITTMLARCRSPWQRRTSPCRPRCCSKARMPENAERDASSSRSTSVTAAKQPAARKARLLSAIKPAIPAIHGSAGAGGAMAWEAAIASAVASTRAGSSGPDAGQMIEGLAFVEAGHFHREFDRPAVAVDCQRSIAALRDRDDAAIDLRRERAVDPDFFVAGGLALFKRRIIQERESERHA